DWSRVYVNGETQRAKKHRDDHEQSEEPPRGMRRPAGVEFSEFLRKEVLTPRSAGRGVFYLRVRNREFARLKFRRTRSFAARRRREEGLGGGRFGRSGLSRPLLGRVVAGGFKIFGSFTHFPVILRMILDTRILSGAVFARLGFVGEIEREVFSRLEFPGSLVREGSIKRILPGSLRARGRGRLLGDQRTRRRCRSGFRLGRWWGRRFLGSRSRRSLGLVHDPGRGRFSWAR